MVSSTAATDLSTAVGESDTVGDSDIEEDTQVCQETSSDANCFIMSATVSLLDRLRSPKELIRARKEEKGAL